MWGQASTRKEMLEHLDQLMLWGRRHHGIETKPMRPAFTKPEGVIGIVCAKDFPDEELIRSKLREGIAKKGNTVTWVVRGPRKANDAISFVYDELEAHGIEPVMAPAVSSYWGTAARSWRDAELLATCERVVVFHDAGSTVTKSFLDAKYTVAKVFVIERGEKKKHQKKGRKVA